MGRKKKKPQPQPKSQSSTTNLSLQTQQANLTIPVMTITAHSIEYENLREENLRLRQRIADLESQNLRLNVEIMNKDKEIVVLRQENAELRARIKQLEDRVNEQDNKIADQNSKITEQNTKISWLCDKLQQQDDEHYLSKLILSIRELDSIHKLRDKMTPYRESLREMAEDRNDECHYLSCGLPSNVITYRIMLMSDKLKNAPQSVKRQLDEIYGSGLHLAIARYIDSLNLSEPDISPSYERGSARWWK
jgi:chromosome segregation ATPase